jgi:hypothetical protein
MTSVGQADDMALRLAMARSLSWPAAPSGVVLAARLNPGWRLVAASPAATSAGDEVKPSDNTQAGADAKAETEENHAGQKSLTRPFRVGVDIFAGRSNIDDARRYSDSMWAGYGPFVPSVAYVQWQNQRGAAARLSLGTGALFNSPRDEFYQPAEAWYQHPVGKAASVTVGKFWVPLAIQEWELESKPGIMAQWAAGAYGVSVAATQNRYTHHGNTYLRATRSFGANATVGFSLTGGKGTTFNSDHDRGAGLDAVLAHRKWHLYSEYLEFRQGSGGRFHFDFVKVSYESFGKWTPYVARYKWFDETGFQGQFDSAVAGLNYQLTSHLALEGAYADTPDKGLWWGQVHWKQEY